MDVSSNIHPVKGPSSGPEKLTCLIIIFLEKENLCFAMILTGNELVNLGLNLSAMTVCRPCARKVGDDPSNRTACIASELKIVTEQILSFKSEY